MRGENRCEDGEVAGGWIDVVEDKQMAGECVERQCMRTCDRVVLCWQILGVRSPLYRLLLWTLSELDLMWRCGGVDNRNMYLNGNLKRLLGGRSTAA